MNPNQQGTDWRVGARVVRKDSEEFGTIVEADDNIKVNWDDGRTSYFHRDKPANVQLVDS